MNTLETTNTYSGDSFKFQLYDSLEDRNNLFGYNFMLSQPLQRQQHNAHFLNTRPGPVQDIRRAPKDYYFNMRTNNNLKTVLGPMDTRPNLYNDNVLPYTRTFERPDLYKSWEPFTTTAVPAMKGERVRWTPHAPCEVAPNNDPRLWVADTNAAIYERGLVTSAREQPYANFNARQGLMNLTSINVPPNNDEYMQMVRKPSDTFCAQLKRNNYVPPATTAF